MCHTFSQYNAERANALILSRAYRVTDRLSLMLLKSGAAGISLSAEGLGLLLGSARPGARRGLLGLLAQIFGGLWVVLAFGVSRLLLLLGLIGAALTWVLRSAASLVTRLLGGVSSRARDSAQDAMARRSTRGEIAAMVVEDPLRTQNRVLGGLVVVMLVALIAVIIAATSPINTPAMTGASSTVNELTVFGPTPAPESAAVNDMGGGQPALGAATPIPTATPLPEVFQVLGSVAFTVRENGQNDLWAVNVGSRTPIRITNDLADERDPAWSPDGTRLAYASNKDGNWEIYIYELATDQTQRMTFNLAFEGGPAWSPDGNWLIYETYQGGSLDVYVLPITDQNASLEPITVASSADFSPAWSPNGRDIVFASWRDGAQDLYVVSLDDISQVTKLTNTLNRHEDYPAWHPDGNLIAYSARDEGIDKVFVKALSRPDDPPELIGRGSQPSWSPDGRSIIAAVDSLESTHLTVYPYEADMGAQQIIAVPSQAAHPTWTDLPLPVSLVNSGGLPLQAPRLYVEQETPFANGLYPLGALTNGIDAPEPSLSDRVNDSFNALRETVLERSGRDFLARLSDAFWSLEQRPQPGEAQRNWHYTGRAIALDRNAALVSFPPTLEIVRVDDAVGLHWQLFLRVDEDAQSGQLGEPLRQMPWDINSRFGDDVEAYDAGGRLRAEMPSGYYIDLTQLAADYGWEPLPAGSDWRLNFNAMNYWAFINSEGLAWLDAMLELWTVDQLGAWAPTPTPLPQPNDEQ